jgi:trigger factor
MAASDNPDIDNPEKDAEDSPELDQADVAGEGGEEEAQRLDLQVQIEEKSACERHITVTVPEEDIQQYFDKEYSEMMPKAQVPGFRPGHAPRKLVEARFHKEVRERVKGELLMDSIAQVNEEEELAAISEPDLDLDAIELPEEGPMTFEFNLEVRPDFELPKWKGLSIERPVREFTAQDVDAALENLLARYGRLVPCDGPAAKGDYISCNMIFRQGETVLSSAEEQVIRVRPVLSFRDGKIEQFDKLMEGVRAGESRSTTTRLSEDAPNESLRGQEVSAVFDVLEVKRLELPELTPAFLDDMGGFESVADLRDAIKDNLKRRMAYQQRQRARDQITAALTVAAHWDLPPELLKRQSRRELERAVMELRRSGFDDEEIRAHENELRQHSAVSTARALKEHFILERIAEEEKIDVVEQDYDAEIALIAAQAGENPRRVRARLEKEGRMDVLRNQIVEGKVVDLILQHAEFHDVPYQPETAAEAEAVDQAAGGGETESEIPEAKPETSE